MQYQPVGHVYGAGKDKLPLPQSTISQRATQNSPNTVRKSG